MLTLGGGNKVIDGFASASAGHIFERSMFDDS
jgi:hypothetical protein